MYSLLRPIPTNVDRDGAEPTQYSDVFHVAPGTERDVRLQ